MTNTLSKLKQNIFWIILIPILLSRFLFLDFGLPLIPQADETELVEYSLNYAVNIKKLFEGDINFFKPFSFVYGTFPSYLNTFLLTGFLKFTSFFDLSQDRYFIYLYLRYFYAAIGAVTCILVYFLIKTLTQNQNIIKITTLLFALNFTFLNLSKYLNNDVLMVFVGVLFFLFFQKLRENESFKNVLILGIILGLGVGTKITFGLFVILPIIYLLKKKKINLFFLLSFFSIIFYAISNPFTFINFNEFSQRILEMRVKENGIVIDSYDPGFFKYLFSIDQNLSTPILVFFIIGFLIKLYKKEFNYQMLIITIFIVFFSFSSRLVDRWLVPIYPLIIFYAIEFLSKFKIKILSKLIIGLMFLDFAMYNSLLSIEYSQIPNINQSYNYFKNELQISNSKILVITHRGQQPFTSLNNKDGNSITDFQFNPYESEGAFEINPPSFENYDYVIFSSRVLDYYSNPEIAKINPNFKANWERYFQSLNKDLNLEKSFKSDFSLTKQENILVFKKRD